MLLFWLILLVVVALPALAYVEYRRYRSVFTVERRREELNHDPPKPPPDFPKRLPNITDVGI